MKILYQTEQPIPPALGAAWSGVVTHSHHLRVGQMSYEETRRQLR